MKKSRNLSSDDELWSLFKTFEDVGCVSGVSGVSCEGEDCEKCPTCKVGNVRLEDGNYICRGCGDLVERFIDTGAEWRYYGYDDSKGNDPTRCGLPMSELLPDSSLGSMIGFSSKETHELRIMRKYHMWNSMSYKELSLYRVFDTLSLTALNNGINKSIIDEAKMLYKKISELKISRGENRNGLIASSIYMACKRNRVARSAKEVAAIFNLKVTTMTKGCKRFQELLNLNMDATGPADFIARFCSKIGMEPEMRDICKHVVNKVEDMSIMCENTPPSIAVAVIYMCSTACEWNIPKQTISAACDVSLVTISKCVAKLNKYRSELLPPAVLKAIEAHAIEKATAGPVKRVRTRKPTVTVV